MKSRAEIKNQIELLSDADFASVLGFLEQQERAHHASAEEKERKAKADEMMAALEEFASDWSEEESFSFQMGIKGFHVRDADADASLREAKVFSAMLDDVSLTEKINALLNAVGHRDEYMNSALRLVRMLVQPMDWAQERAFDIGLTARMWAKHDALEPRELAAFTLALIEKTQIFEEELRERVNERNAQLKKENPTP